MVTRCVYGAEQLTYGNLSELHTVDPQRYVLSLASVIYTWMMRRWVESAFTSICSECQLIVFRLRVSTVPLDANVSSYAS